MCKSLLNKHSMNYYTDHIFNNTNIIQPYHLMIWTRAPNLGDGEVISILQEIDTDTLLPLRLKLQCEG